MDLIAATARISSDPRGHADRTRGRERVPHLRRPTSIHDGSSVACRTLTPSRRPRRTSAVHRVSKLVAGQPGPVRVRVHTPWIALLAGGWLVRVSPEQVQRPTPMGSDEMVPAAAPMDARLLRS